MGCGVVHGHPKAIPFNIKDMIDLTVPKYELNHSRPVTAMGNFSLAHADCSSQLDVSIVEQKFKLWDKVIAENLLASEDELVRSKALRLLKDKTILAYANLKFDGVPIKMLYLQDAILSDPSDRILFCGCNQHIGKSFTLNVDAATEFMIDHDKNWIGILVSGSLPQSQFQMDRIKMLLKSSNISYREEETIDTKTGKKDNTTQLSYTFYAKDGKTPLYRNLLICCPHTSSALGYPVDNLWLDEFDFWENCDQQHFMYQIAIPRTFKTGGKIKVYTNPDGKEKMMYKLWCGKDEFGNSAWHRYQFNYWDKPGANQQEFNKLIIGMTKHQIESTLLAVFTRTEGSFFSSEEIKDMLNIELSQKGDSAGYGKETVWFLDVGSVHDQSVLVGAYKEVNPVVPDIPKINVFWLHKYPVGYPLARVVGVDNAIDANDGWEDYVVDNPPVKEVLAQYSEEVNGVKFNPLFGFDATGNAGMLPLLTVAGIEAMDVTFTGKLKWHMYQRYQYYVQQRFIKRAKERDQNTVRGCDFDYQASKLVVKKDTKTSYKQIHHESEDDLDDCCDATAALVYLIENPDVPSLSFDVISTQPEQGQENLVDNSSSNLNNQYIPSFINKSELTNWIEQREKQMR